MPNSLPSTRNFTSTQQSCPGLSFLWMEVNFLRMEVPGTWSKLLPNLYFPVFFACGGVMDDAKNKIYLERGPRAEWGPGSARAPIKSFNLEPCTRTQDPFHSEDPFQRKLCSNSLPSTRNFTSTQQSCPGLSFLWMEVNFLWMEVPGSTLFLTWWPTVAVCFLRVGGDG